MSMAKGKKKVEGSHGRAAAVQPNLPAHPGPLWQIWLCAGIIIIVGITAYLNSFDGVFLYDDTKSIVENPHIRSLWPLSEAMSFPLAESGATVAGRPILSLSFAVNYALFGPEPWGYHLVNLAIHIFAGLLLFGIVRRTLSLKQFQQRYGQQAIWLAVAVALLWLVHPVQSESVTYIVQRAESMMGMFFLLMLYCAVRGFQSNRCLLWYSASVLSCALGMGTKEVMVAAPVIVLLYDYVFISGSLKKSVRRRWVLYGALAASWSILIIQILVTSETIGEDLQLRSPLGYALTQLGVILYYLKLSAWPSKLVMDYDWPMAKTAAEIILPSLVILSMVALTGWGLFHRRWFGFVCAWFFFILAPSSSFIPTMQNLHVHRIYLPLAAVIVLVVVGWEFLLQKLWRGPEGKYPRQVITGGLVLAIVVTLGYLTYERNKDYHSAFALWADNVEKRPESKLAHFNFGNMLMQRGELTKAAVQYEYALRLDPNDAGAHHNLGEIFAKQGNIIQARVQYERALSINPRLLDARNNLGNVFLKLGKPDLAKAQYEYALSIDPNDADSHNNLGNILMQQGKLNEAMAQYKQVLRLDPDYANAHYNLGTVLMQQGKLKQAQAQYEYALSINPNHSDTHHNLGVAFMREGNMQQAKARFENVLRINPADADAHNNLGEVLIRLGKPFQAATHYEKVLEINPNNLIVINNLAWLLATYPDDNFRNGKRAVELAEWACKVTDYKIPKLLDTLAAAYAEEKRFTEAIETATKALESAELQKNPAVQIQQIRFRLEQYKAGKPFHQQP